MKVNNAMVCMNCDEMFVGEECPCCLGHTYFPLRKWFKPLHSFNEIKEAKDEAKKNRLLLQKGREESLHIAGGFDNSAYVPAEQDGEQLESVQPGEQATTGVYHKAESRQSEAGPSSDNCGEQMERKGCVKSWRSWFDAGYAFISEAVWFYKRRFVMSGQKH